MLCRAYYKEQTNVDHRYSQDFVPENRGAEFEMPSGEGNGEEVSLWEPWPKTDFGAF